MAESYTTYEVTWASKPLGFSIIMDTDGLNAYVSSIQNEANKKKGVRLASQIVKVNDDDVEGLKHQVILHKIIRATTPITLVFKSLQDKKDHAPAMFNLAGSPERVAHRCNGNFSLLADTKLNDREVWERLPSDSDNPEEQQTIWVWYWPSSEHKITGKNGLWVISRKEHVGKMNLYAAAEEPKDSSYKYPTMVTEPWRIFDGKNFIDCPLKISQKEAGAEDP